MSDAPLHVVPPDPIRSLADGLAADGGLKLWSVIVTCLGDLSQAEAGEISGLTLSALVERIGLQPQAMRVALHRLKRDGWIESRRVGRVSYHRLSANGLAQTRAVADRIYGPATHNTAVHLVGLPPDVPDAVGLLPEGLAAVPISRSFLMVVGDISGLPEDCLVAAPDRAGLPPWVTETLREAGCEAAFAAYRAALPTRPALPQDGLDRLAMRVIALHGWRRLALRSNPAAEAALGPVREEVACREAVFALLDHLGPASDLARTAQVAV